MMIVSVVMIIRTVSANEIGVSAPNDLCPSHCISCDSKGKCFTCENGYFLDSGFCGRCSYGCKSCKSSDKCTECSKGYYSVSNFCYSCSSGCSSCYSYSSCSYCKDGYYWEDGYCYVKQEVVMVFLVFLYLACALFFIFLIYCFCKICCKPKSRNVVNYSPVDLAGQPIPPAQSQVPYSRAGTFPQPFPAQTWNPPVYHFPPQTPQQQHITATTTNYPLPSVSQTNLPASN